MVIKVLYEEKSVALIQRKTDGHLYKSLPEYEVELAEGVHTSLVMPPYALERINDQKWILLIVRADLCHGHCIGGAYLLGHREHSSVGRYKRPKTSHECLKVFSSSTILYETFSKVSFLTLAR